jgi:hypothetical protein
VQSKDQVGEAFFEFLKCHLQYWIVSSGFPSANAGMGFDPEDEKAACPCIGGVGMFKKLNDFVEKSMFKEGIHFNISLWRQLITSFVSNPDGHNEFCELYMDRGDATARFIFENAKSRFREISHDMFVRRMVDNSMNFLQNHHPYTADLYYTHKDLTSAQELFSFENAQTANTAVAFLCCLVKTSDVVLKHMPNYNWLSAVSEIPVIDESIHANEINRHTELLKQNKLKRKKNIYIYIFNLNFF